MNADPGARRGAAPPPEAAATGVPAARVALWVLASVVAVLLPWALIAALGLSDFLPAPTSWQIIVPTLATLLAGLATDRATRQRGWNAVAAGLLPPAAHAVTVAVVHLLSIVPHPWGPEVIDWAVALVGIQLITPTPLLLWIASMFLLIDHPFRRQVTP